ncbi:acyltransferase [Aeromonas rivipollensis]|uniref:acyltransferase n=1 Tax=Aeromonas rivipollensis TaxID=948519 RepID=UPI003D1E7EAF
MRISHKIKMLFLLSPFKRYQYIENLYFKLKMRFFYRLFFLQSGRGSLIRKPLLLTPEFINLGRNVFIWDAARIEGIKNHGNQKFNPKIIIGDGVTIQQRCHITAAGELFIGDNCLISFDVMIQDTDHVYSDITIPVGLQPLSVNQTIIGEQCFIGSGAKIMAGSHLGKHCIVGCNSVVRGHYPDYSVLVGNPAKIIKRFSINNSQWERNI